MLVVVLPASATEEMVGGVAIDGGGDGLVLPSEMVVLP
jgi:hypothetical protein